MAFEKKTWTDYDMKIMAEDLNRIEDGIYTAVGSYNSEIVAGLDGTQATYNSQMRTWFRANGAQDYADVGDYESLTALVDEWYDITRDSWYGYTEYYQPDISAVSTGTKGGNNAGLICEPSTDTVEGQDDYAGLPLFACVDCNWYVDENTLEPMIMAINGITDNFKRTDPDIYVGVLQMSGYEFHTDGSETYIDGYSALPNIPFSDIKPRKEAVRVDGTFRNWVVHTKYMSQTQNGKMTACSGMIPTAWASHNTLHTLSKANGSQYSGGTVLDDSWLKLMASIKYGSMTLDGILQGCVNNSYQYYAQASETGVRRILIPTSHNLEVGMGVLIGDYSSSTDRGSLYSVTGQAGAIITRIETVSITDTDEDGSELETSTNYTAVYVDTDATFDTAANGSAAVGTTYISTFHWPTGSCDTVLGNDGSPTNCTSGKYPAKLQGIEYSVGAYEVYADVILSLYQDSEDETVYYYEPYTVNASANQSTSITSDYAASGLTCVQPGTSSWQYIKKLGRNDGVWFPIEVGGSSSTYTRDGFYMNAATTGTREWLAFGDLSNSVGTGGLSYLVGAYGLTGGAWYFAARLSPNGNRGEWTA